jgi:hypothetical protein
MPDIFETVALASVTATFGGLFLANVMVTGLKAAGRGDLAARFVAAIHPVTRHFRLIDDDRREDGRRA